jgi:hypothetical protein
MASLKITVTRSERGAFANGIEQYFDHLNIRRTGVKDAAANTGYFMYAPENGGAQVRIETLVSKRVLDYAIANAAMPTQPSATTQAGSSVTATGATLNGTAVFGQAPVAATKGFVYSSTVSIPTRGTAGVTDTTTTPLGSAGAYTKAVTGLTASTLYKVRAYVIDDEGKVYYGNVVDVTTPAS